MKKIEILNLINASRIIEKNKKLLSITRDKRFENILINEEEWFPQVKDLKEEFAILEKEILSALEETEQATNILKCGCNHEIRLEHFGLFGRSYQCIFCGNFVPSDNCVTWEYSNNRNKYCVSLIAKYQKDEECDNVPNGYTNEQVYEIIMNILKDKKDEEDVDLVQEFKKLNLKNCKINEEKKINENYILIIGGSNKQFIDEESYLHKKGLNIGLDFIKYFSEFLNTKVELIDNREILNSEEFKRKFPNRNYNLKFTKYDTTQELEKILKQQKDIPFKIIIDISELYEYKVCDNDISKEVYNINLNERFPNSHIIRINNFSKSTLEELSEYLKSIQVINGQYAYKNKQYYYLENSEIKSSDLENTCYKIKKLLKKQ